MTKKVLKKIQDFFNINLKLVNINNGDIVIESYEIKIINGEEKLFLYFNYKYEFGLFNKHKNKSIKDEIKDYLIKNKINYKGTIIGIVVGGILIGNLILNKPIINNEFDVYKADIINVDKFLYIPEIKIEKEIVEVKDEVITNNDNITDNVIKEKSNNISKNNSNIVNNNDNKSYNTSSNHDVNKINEISSSEEKVVDTNTYVKVKRSNGSVDVIELEEYIIGVVSAEMPAMFHKEALKSQAVIARTYALKAINSGKTLTDNESTQSYKSKEELKILWGGNYNSYYNKIQECVNETKGMYLTYNGNYIDAVYHSTSNTKTESSSNVWGNFYPYLVSVDSPYDSLNPSFLYEVNFTYEELSNKLGMEITNDTNFNILETTSGGRVANIEINEKIYKGIEFRNLLGLRSADFKIEKNETGVKIITKGYGHGVGLSQYGANGFAKNGYSFKDILKHYYKGVEINKI